MTQLAPEDKAAAIELLAEAFQRQGVPMPEAVATAEQLVNTALKQPVWPPPPDAGPPAR
jgi:hypothetical protein